MAALSSLLRSIRPLRVAAPILIACATLLPSGCERFRGGDLLGRGGPAVFIPLQDTAYNQYQYAVRERQRNEIALRDRTASPRREDARRAVAAAFRMVVEQFPEDRAWTPLARLDLADMQAGLDVSGGRASASDLKASIAEFRRLREEFPELEYIQAKARYDEAVAWRELKDFGRAQELFKEVSDLYRASSEKDLQYIAQMADLAYQKTYIKK